MVSFTAVGLVIAFLGLAIGLDGGVLRAVAAGLMVLFGVTLLVPPLQVGFARLLGPLAGGGGTVLGRLSGNGLGGQFGLGLLLGAVWSPCTGPTLGAAVGLAAQGENLFHAGLVMAAFSLGAAAPVLALAYGSRQALMARRERMARLANVAKPAMGVVLAVVGLLVLLGIDKMIEAVLVGLMPPWLVDLTTRI